LLAYDEEIIFSINRPEKNSNFHKDRRAIGPVQTDSVFFFVVSTILHLN